MKAPSPFDFCARCGHARANHGHPAHPACLFRTCGCPDFVEPLRLDLLVELRARLERRRVEADNAAAHCRTNRLDRPFDFESGRAAALELAIALLDELVPGVRP